MNVTFADRWRRTAFAFDVGASVTLAAEVSSTERRVPARGQRRRGARGRFGSDRSGPRWLRSSLTEKSPLEQPPSRVTRSTRPSIAGRVNTRISGTASCRKRTPMAVKVA